MKQQLGTRLVTEGKIESTICKYFNDNVPFPIYMLLWLDDIRNAMGWFILTNR